MLRDIDYRKYLLTTYASWLGKNIGIRLGAPVEGWTSEKIEKEYQGKEGYLIDYDIFAADDDSNGPLFFVRGLLDKNELTAEDIGNTFFAYLQQYSGFFWWGGVGVSTEHTAYENLKNGIKAPLSGSKERNGIVIAEQIGGQIFSDCWGYVSGYDPAIAKYLAMKASSVTHDGNGIEGGIFVAVSICLAYKKNNIFDVLNEALEYLNPEMEYYQKVKLIMDYYYAHPDNWRDCLKYIQENFGYDKYPGVCHIIPNLCVMVMGLCYGENDFSKTLTIINQSGWDTDCNCGNAGSIMGALIGIDGIDKSWITPINDVVNASSCIGYLNIQTISDSSKMFAQLAFKLQGIEIKDREIFDLPYATKGFRSEDNIEVKNNELLIAGNKVYNYSYYLGNDIYDSRYDPCFSPLIYPNDEICFLIKGNGKYRIFVEDCENNLEYSNWFDEGNISYVVKTGINKTIRRYGIEASKDNFIIADYFVKHQPVLNIDFRNYPVDEYGPRYDGDSLFNLRGFVVHSGKYEISKNGLHFYNDNHGFMSTLVPTKIRKLQMEFIGDNLLVNYWIKDYQNFKAVGIQNGQIVYIEKISGEFKTRVLADKKIKNTRKYIFNLLVNNGRIYLYFDEDAFDIAIYNEAGIIGVSSEVGFDAYVVSLIVS